MAAMFVNGSGQNEQFSSVDANYQVSVYLAHRFQRRRLKCEKLTDDGHQVMEKAHFAVGEVKQQVLDQKAYLATILIIRP